MNFQRLSLQARLVALMLVAVTLFGLLAGYESYKNALHEVDEIFDAQLAQLGQTLLAIAIHADDDETESTGPIAHKYQRALAFQVWSTEHDQPRLLLHSGKSAAALPDRLPEEGFSHGEWQGERWRFYRQSDPRRQLEVVVGQTTWRATISPGESPGTTCSLSCSGFPCWPLPH